MRKAERIITDKRHKMPERYKKVDTAVNGDAETLVEMHKEVEKKLYPLRIDKRTVIYVTKDKLTPEYAEIARNKLNHRFGDTIPAKGGQQHIAVDVDAMKGMLKKGMTLKDIARNIGVSRTTISNYISIYNLRDGK